MPPRRARSSVPNAIPKVVRSKFKKRTLDAYSAASQDIKEKRVPQHRLGEDIEDEPRHKRRRDEDDEDEDSDGKQQSRQKRRTSRPISDANDDVQYGSDSSGNEWAMGGLGEEDDDSELDSDEAFGDSDEERFEGFTFRGSSSGKGKAKKRKPSATSSRSAKRILDEDSGVEDDDDGDSQDDAGEGLGDDAVDLAAMLDDNDDAVLGGKDHTREELGEDSASSGDDEDGEEDEDEDGEEEESDASESDKDDEEDNAADEERVARMMDRLENLDSSRTPRQVANAESTSDLTLEDLLSGVDAESRKQFEGETKSKKKSSKATTISAPLPKRQQDRLDRQVATQKAKEQLDRWHDTVIKNRRAEFLSFPMIDPNDQSKSLGKENFTPASQGKPRTELEENIQRIMEESGLSNKPGGGTSAQLGDEETALLKSEELATNKLPVEEVMRRRAELRKARDLLFREEIKAKRIAKIKSKSYRRVHRKERAKMAEQERQALQGPGGDDGMDDDDLEKADRRRAEARMATKHKDSKWAKTLKATNRTVWDDDARDSVMDQAKRNEDLKRRIAGKDVQSDDDDGDFDSEEDHESDENGENTLQRLKDLDRDSSYSDKGLSGMKFMRAAEERKRKANEEEVEQLRKELAIEAGEEEESEAENGGLGRAIFGPQARTKVNGINGITKTQKSEFEAPEDADDDDDNDDNDNINDLNTGESAAKSPAEKTQGRKDSAPKSILKNVQKAKRPLKLADRKGDQGNSIEADGSKTAVSEWLSKPVKGTRKQQSSDAVLDLALDVSLPTTDTAKARPKSSIGRNAHQTGQDAPSTDGWTTVKHKVAKGNEDSDSEEHLNPILSAQEQRASLQQRAFAGDDVEIAFDAEKADIADSEDEKETSNFLPGWGSWTGNGLSKSVRKTNARARHNPLYKSKGDGVRQADRKDANLKNVIISEKQDRKGKKYLAPILPHEYETKAQYERSRRLPMGPEWSTKEVHQRMTRPRVVVKPGVRIEALERPMV